MRGFLSSSLLTEKIDTKVLKHWKISEISVSH